MDDINFVAVVVAGLSAFFLGFFWYTIIFAKPWQKEIGLKIDPKNTENPNLGMSLVGSLILEMIMAFVMAWFIGKDADTNDGLMKGLAAGVLVACAFGVNYFFEGKTLKHWAINASYNVVVFAVMGLVIGAL